ncbi:MAG: amidinotransferase [Saprospiraceae bacterium]|nr:amidinotransferase [Saprospiraceae bacterium]
MTSVSTHKILMIRPSHFGFNSETAESNAFQQEDTHTTPEDISKLALQEFDLMVITLRQAGIEVEVVEDTASPVKPDAIFPNNWISFHNDGTLVTYPMQAKARRAEVRMDLVNQFRTKWGYTKALSLDQQYPTGPFLEGTGSLILDRVQRIAYACISPRTDLSLFADWAGQLGYMAIPFTAADENGQLIYHTNVMMALGDGYAVICLDSIPDARERQLVTDQLADSGKEVVDISFDQMNHFAGNMLQVLNQEGQPYLIMSEQARQSLLPEQVRRLSAHATLLDIPLWTIERIGGGSARCMMAEVFLPG